MTVILAAMDSDGKVKIGGDAQASTGYDYSYKLDCPKVMKIGEYLMEMIDLLNVDVLGDRTKISFHYTSKTSRVFSIDLIRNYGE